MNYREQMKLKAKERTTGLSNEINHYTVLITAQKIKAGFDPDIERIAQDNHYNTEEFKELVNCHVVTDDCKMCESELKEKWWK